MRMSGWAWLLGVACVGATPETDVDSEVDSEVDSDTDPVDSEPVDSDPIDFDFAAAPELVTIEAGSFQMGSPLTELGRDVGEVLHAVTLSYAFGIGRIEVNQGQYAARMGLEPSLWGGCPLCPVERVSWHEAAAFTNALSEAEGLTSCYSCATREVPVVIDTGSDEEPGPVEYEYRCEQAVAPPSCDGYRLPTEAEWEFVARERGALTAATVAGGGLLSREASESCNPTQRLDNDALLTDFVWYCGNSDATPGSTTRPGGLMPANALGLYDLSGNVWELMHDWYQPALSDLAESDPFGPEAGEYRVVRGGGWNSVPKLLRLSFRTTARPIARADNVGFRVARTLTPAAR